MPPSFVIDGKAIATEKNRKTAEQTVKYKEKTGQTPCLAVVLVGEDPASSVYVRNKAITAGKVGFRSLQKEFPSTVSEEQLLDTIRELNEDPEVNGILVQLPLPPQIDSKKVIQLIEPAKDVDGFHPINAGRLVTGELDEALLPCTPAGCIEILRSVHGNQMAGLHAVVVGRSNIVGKPVAHLLLAENCTVTITHSHTPNLQEITRNADILVVAVGKPECIKGDMIKTGATVVDVGINRISSLKEGEPSFRLVGDVDFTEACRVAGAITPVPGGVGPMTIAMLMWNTLTAAIRQNRLH